jgi:hypothetical protein
MWRRFWFKDRAEGVKGSYAVEVLFASWIPPLPQLPVEVTPVRSGTGIADTGAFLTRVYANQEC